MNVRNATVDFIFYPGKAEELADTVHRHLKEAENSGDSAPVILSPHAGYGYAGNFMGAAYKAASAADFSRVVILSRVHREPDKVLFLPESTAFRTPLGDVEVDSPWISSLLQADPHFKQDDIPHTEEHSIEVQLPFIQVLWPQAKIVPILSGVPSLSLMRILGGALRQLVRSSSGRTLFVVSSNLSAYDHPEDAKRDTDHFLSLLEKGEWESFPDLLRQKKINACSADCLTAVYVLFNGHLKPELLGKECDFDGIGEYAKKPFEKRVCFGALAFKQTVQ